ncbi:MAG: hypothetical protein ACE37J_14780 [Pikeienuella sp.]|uniref:hypothetical protein n=1 Tax=Pikeienuella sp. TaxID=2831957 RepID=UPI003918FE65
MTTMLETTSAPILLPGAETEAARRFRALMDAEARVDGPQGSDDEADAALDTVLAAPITTLADLAAVVIAAATANAPEPDSAVGKVERAARSILVAAASACAVTGTRPDTEARRLYLAWVATEDRANEEGDSDAVKEASGLAMQLVCAPITCTADLALMAHTLLFLGDAYVDRWDVLRERLAKCV